MISKRDSICSLFFGIKAVFALLLSFTGLALLGWQVSVKYQQGMLLKRDQTAQSTPIQIFTDGRCDAPTGNIARLENPGGRVLWGMSLAWSQITPIQMANRVNGYQLGVT